MKILAIRLKNLASLAGEQEIDFTREPLSSAGLFAITGPTGAGKSTVLDALCLALFGSTPRLESTSASSKVPDGRNELSSNDERNLLRRGCASGYAEVDFVGIDGHRYRARWETRRSRDKADGALQKSQQSLQDLETQQMLAANKKSEFREQLEQKLGLNFAQFTRAVLLAQSEFSAFLKASDNDRGALLEKLTDTGLYSQLSKAAYQRASQADEQRKQLEQRLEGSLPLAEQARAGLEAALESHAQARLQEQQAPRRLEGQQQWFTEEQRLLQSCEHAQGQLAEARQAWDALATERETLQWLERLAPVRGLIERLKQLEQEPGTPSSSSGSAPSSKPRAPSACKDCRPACRRRASARPRPTTICVRPRRRCARLSSWRARPGAWSERWPSDRNSIGNRTSATPSKATPLGNWIWSSSAMSRNRRNCRRHCATARLSPRSATPGRPTRASSPPSCNVASARSKARRSSPSWKNPWPTPGTARTLAGAMDRPPWQRAGRPGGTPGRIAPADR
ncbi:SMC family ATPase [Pseudomonas aeruginosa]